jgi:hypothetical protein
MPGLPRAFGEQADGVVGFGAGCCRAVRKYQPFHPDS